MKTNQGLIPLAGVTLVPRGAVRYLIAVACMATATTLALVGHGLVVGDFDRTQQPAAVAAAIAAYAAITAWISGRSDRRPRATAPLVFAHLQTPRPLPVRNWIAAFLLLVLGIYGVAGPESALRTGVPLLGMLLGALFYVVHYRRLMHRQATAVFTLYVDGLLEPEPTAAIDDARAKDPAFDAAVREHQRLCALVTAELRGTEPQI